MWLSRLRWVMRCLCDISAESHRKLKGDVSRVCTTLTTVDEKAILRAALITLRRAICERVPAGREATSVAYTGGDRPPPRGLGRATATTSATFLPQFEQRIRVESAASVTDLPPVREVWRERFG